MKYEYMIKTWGGFYNDQYKSLHGLEPGYFWFPTEDLRDQFLNNLKVIEFKLDAKRLVYSLSEGTNTRVKTIAKMKLCFNDKEYSYQMDFGFAYDPESAVYMFYDGSYSCDCNLSSFIRRNCNPTFEEMECGETIKIKDFEIVLVS